MIPSQSMKVKDAQSLRGIGTESIQRNLYKHTSPKMDSNNGMRIVPPDSFYSSIYVSVELIKGMKY